MPPSTDAMVVSAANQNVRGRLASDIGASITSGGIGKNDDSAKLSAHSQ